MNSNFLQGIQAAMRDKLIEDLRVKAILTPGGRTQSNEQLPETVFKVGWDQMGNFEIVTRDPRIVQCTDCQFLVSLESKNLKLHDRAMDFIVFCVAALNGLSVFEGVEPLMPISAGYRGHNPQTGYSTYEARFSTCFHWYDEFNFSPIDITVPNEYELSLELWGTQPDNMQLLEAIT